MQTTLSEKSNEPVSSVAVNTWGNWRIAFSKASARGGRTQLDVDLRLDRQAEGRGVDDGADTADDAGLGELAHPVGDGIGAQVDGGADVGERASAVVLKDSEDFAVDLVHRKIFSCKS